MELTINEMFKALSKKSLKALDNAEDASLEEYYDTIKMLYEYQNKKKVPCNLFDNSGRVKMCGHICKNKPCKV